MFVARCTLPTVWRKSGVTRKVAASFSSVSERVKTEIDSNGVAQVTLSRPEKLNALDLPMFEAIAQTAASLRSDKSLRAVIISGEGKGEII